MSEVAVSRSGWFSIISSAATAVLCFGMAVTSFYCCGPKGLTHAEKLVRGKM